MPGANTGVLEGGGGGGVNNQQGVGGVNNQQGVGGGEVGGPPPPPPRAKCGSLWGSHTCALNDTYTLHCISHGVLLIA